MALQAPSQTASFDQSGVYTLSLDSMVDAILLDDDDFIANIGFGGGDGKPVTQTKHEWDEDALNPVIVAASSSTGQLSTSSSKLYLLSAQMGRVTAGTLLKDQLSGKYEVLQVTARSGISASITRGYGSTSAETHANSAVYDIIANPRPQGMTAPKDESTIRVRSFNYTQIFSKGVQLTGTATAIQHNGISSEDSYQIDNRTRELIRELDRAAIMGIRIGQVSATVYGTMGGIMDYIKHGYWGATTATGNTNSTAEALTPSVINAMVKQIFDDGGTPDMILVGGAQKQKISSFDKEYRRSTLDTRRAGFTVEEFVSDLGPVLRVVVDRWVPADFCFVLDTSRIAVKPLQTRSFFLEKLAKTGDFEGWQIVGEYTMEVKQAPYAHAIHTNLKS
jgi:hypothetical protein